MDKFIYSMIISDKGIQRNRQFQKNPEIHSLRQQRESCAIELRKKKRVEHLSKKRACSYINLSPTFVFPANILPNWINLSSHFVSETQKLVMLMNSIKYWTSPDALLESVTCLKILNEKNASFPFGQVFDDGVVDLFYGQLLGSTGNSELKRQILWILINAFFDSAEIVNKFVNKGIVEGLCRLICNELHREVLENSIWCLGNLLGESEAIRARALSQNIHTVLLNFASGTDIALKRTSFWVLSNLCKGKTITLSTAFSISSIISKGLTSDDIEITMESAWICYYLSEKFSELLNSLFESNLIPILLTHLHSTNAKIQFPVLKVFGNISASTDSQCEYLLKLGFISIIAPMLTHPAKSFKKEVLFIFSNLLAGSGEIALAVLNSPCMRTIVEFMSCNVFEIKKEAVWGVCNAACNKDLRVVMKVLEIDVIQVLVQCLVHNDAALIENVVSAIGNLLDVLEKRLSAGQWKKVMIQFEEAQGFERINQLFSHPNFKVHQEVENFLCRYSSRNYFDESNQFAFT